MHIKMGRIHIKMCSKLKIAIYRILSPENKFTSQITIKNLQNISFPNFILLVPMILMSKIKLLS